MDPISLQRLSEAAPEFRRRAVRMTDALAQEGIPIRWTEVLRSYTRQAQLYAQGRTAPGRRVTNAPPGESVHEYGGAGDCAPLTLPHGQPDWNETHDAWKRIVAVGESCGLRAGARFKHNPDAPHFELPEMPAKPTDAMRTLLATHGLVAVWAAARVIEPIAAFAMETKTEEVAKAPTKSTKEKQS